MSLPEADLSAPGGMSPHVVVNFARKRKQERAVRLIVEMMHDPLPAIISLFCPCFDPPTNPSNECWTMLWYHLFM
jgi:hypothetical protein